MDQQKKRDVIRNIYTKFEPTAYLFPTMKCNLSCRMCYSGSAMHRPVKNELNDEEFLTIVDSLLKLGYRRFDVSGGEPLLRAGLLYQLAKKLRQHGAKLQLVTNGTFVIKTLEQYPFEPEDFDFIAVSLDSPDEVTHDKIRGCEKTYQRAIEGIQALVERGFTVGINAVYMMENKALFPELLKLAKKLQVVFVHILRNRYVSPFPSSLDEIEGIDWRQLYDGLEECLDIAREDLLVVAVIPQYIHQEYAGIIRRKFRGRENILIRTDCIQGCGAFNRNIVITSDGYVTGCVAMINEPDLQIGNVREMEISVLLRECAKRMEAIEARSRDLHDRAVCKECSSYLFCKGGCPMVAVKYYKDYKKGDPSCPKIYKQDKKKRGLCHER